MFKYFSPVIVLIFISCSGSKPGMLLPEKVSPEIYDVLLENEIVKVMKVSFAPGPVSYTHLTLPTT